ncbi:MAG TPA: discoidin domain-containing protein [Gemmatimonadales bacterium]|nr:discoidin domain-containing protein [Gemmatimonadales bacterium]
MITSFTANPSSIPYGSSTTLQWATTGATQTTIAPAPGSVAPPSGGSVSTGALTTTTTYTLTATNAAGARVTATVRINVSLLCAAGLADCNGNTADGCETSYLSDSQNCGACGNRCASGMSCYGGQCAESCDAPQLPAPFPGCVNVASLAQASASSIFTDPPYGPPSAAFDGNQCTYWNAGVHAPAWIQASFAQPTTLRAFVMVPEATPNSDVHHVIESSDDGVTFTTRLEIYDYHEDRKVYTYALPAPVTARYWRVSSLSSESWIAWADIGMYSCP